MDDETLETYELPPKQDRKFKHYFFYPILKTRAFFVRIAQVCGWRFVAFLVVTQFFVKGLLYRVSNDILLPIFKDLGVEVSELQLFTTIVATPWVVKPLIGSLSDLVTVNGYNKRFWMIQSVIIGIVASAFAFPTMESPLLLVVCFVGVNYEMAILDLMSEAKYSAIIQSHPKVSSDIVSFVNALSTLGTIVALSFIGHLSDEKLYWVLLLISLVVAAIPLVPVILGWLPEYKMNDRWLKFDHNLFQMHKSTFIVIMFSGVAGPIVGFLATFTSNKLISLICATMLLAASVVGSFMVFPRIVAQIGLYLVLVRISKPSISTPLDYFFTADAACLPDGPHFTYKYYRTYTGLISAGIGFFAVWVYQVWLSKLRFRTVLALTTVLVGLAGIFDMLIVLRVNEKMGINDHVFYIFGESIIETAVEMLFWVPSSIIIAKSCPKNLESSTFAFLAGLSNFGLIVSELSGAIIFEAAGITKCNFDALWWLILCFHILTPIIGGIPAAFLVPNEKQDLAMMDETEMEGSKFLIRETQENNIELTYYTSDESGALDHDFDF